MIYSLPAQEIYLVTGSYSKERVESCFPSFKYGMNKSRVSSSAALWRTNFVSGTADPSGRLVAAR